MSEHQKFIIDKLLKEKKKTKRELADLLNITENSISRTLKNPNISIRKLEKIANFLEIELSDIIEMKNASSIAQEEKGEYKILKNKNKEDALNSLSEVIKIQGRTIEMMVETEKANSKNIENLVKLLSDKYSGSDK
ncbi:MAG: helix-turn-helix domain-containing protein [Prevotellaceae bacterium]|jgi:DNA-binding Xre family transcriptional regulator|nr:helix-turn-helix domain-containing protein [Prevotellaceae bacterium]